MNEYVLSVIGTVLIASVLTAILPEGKTSGIIKGITRLVCVVAIVAPVVQFLQSKESELGIKKTSGIFSENVIEVDESFIQYYSETRVGQTEEALEEELKDKFGCSVSVKLAWEIIKETYEDKYPIENVRITQISIKNTSEASEETMQEMAEYVAKNYCSEVLIE